MLFINTCIFAVSKSSLIIISYGFEIAMVLILTKIKGFEYTRQMSNFT